MNNFEIILIGTGGGYGESILVKLCNDDWIIVDSCVDPNTKDPLPLVYLQSLNVNLAQSVKLIVCSHWHDDHINGLDRILDECKTADFCVTMASDKEKFLKFIEYDSRPKKEETSSTKVLRECLNILAKRNSSCKNAIQNRCLYRASHNGNNMEVFCLSPLDKTIEKFGEELSCLLKSSTESNIRIPYQSPNDKSVVLYVGVNEHCVLLGSDYENKNHRWKILLNNYSETIKDKPFSLVKIPHHGSENAYEELLWTNFVADDVCGVVSRFKKGNCSLPTKVMLEKYYGHTENLYITSDLKSQKLKDRARLKAKIIKEMNRSIREIPFNYGVVICKMDIDNNNSSWNIHVEGSAKRVDEKFIDNINFFLRKERDRN